MRHMPLMAGLRRIRTWLVPSPPAAALLVCLVGAYCLRKALSLPILPTITGDSEGYLSFADYRPPGYPSFLYIYQIVFDGLMYLPQIQLVLFFTSVLLLALAAALITQNNFTAFLVAGFGGIYIPGFDPASVMADCLYASLLITGVAFFLFFISTGYQSLVWLAALFFGLAATTRSIGYVLIPAFVLSLAFLVVFYKERVSTAVLAMVPLVVVFTGACSITYAQTGHFRIGSFAGFTLLGKGLLAAKPLPAEHPLSSLNWISAEVEPAQLELDRAPSVIFKMLMSLQYYEYLTWDKMTAELDARWPAWGKVRAGHDRAKLALELSKAYMAYNPMACAKLVLLDYGALWIMPRVLTKSEQAALQRTWEGLDVAFLTSFEKTKRRDSNFRKVVPQAYVSDAQVWLFRLISISFALASVLVPVVLITHRTRVVPSVVVPLVLIGLIVHFSYAATALAASGADERFVFPTWPLIVAALALLPHLRSADLLAVVPSFRS